MGDLLLPRLPEAFGRQLLSEMADLKPAGVRKYVEENIEYTLSMATFTSVGGQRQGGEALARAVAYGLRELAEKDGYPRSPKVTRRRSFDLRAAVFLHQKLSPAVPAEPMRLEWWQLLACVLVPDLVLWRFRGRDGNTIAHVDEQRFLGSWVRNTFSRLWWRAELLSDPGEGDPYHLIDTAAGGLLEDNMVALIERPWTAGHPQLAKTIAQVFLRTLDSTDFNEDVENPRQLLMRELMKRVIRRSSYTVWTALTHEETSAVVEEIAAETVSALHRG